MPGYVDTNIRAMQILSRLQKSLHRRLARFVTDNEAMLRQAATGAEGYGYTLQQLDELFLSRLNLIERTMAELHKSPTNGVSRYRSLVFSASRDNVEAEVNARLDRIPSARILGVTVSPASASSRVTYQFSEMGMSRLAAAREEEEKAQPELADAEQEDPSSSTPDAGALIEDAARTDTEPPEPAEAGSEHEDADDEYDYSDLDSGPDSDSDEEYLVTVLYYGPVAASGA